MKTTAALMNKRRRDTIINQINEILDLKHKIWNNTRKDKEDNDIFL